MDATPVENRIERFPSQMIWVMWTRIVIGSAKHEIIGADILGAFKMLHQDTLERPIADTVGGEVAAKLIAKVTQQDFLKDHARLA